jgi:DNA ligase (NAD+)
MMEEIIKLINELNKASELYYNGKDSFLTDAEFDKKLDELASLENKHHLIYSNSPTINVGSRVLSQLDKTPIYDKPMLSLGKVHSAKEIVDFSDGYDIIASVKCDGLSVRLIYENGNLLSANTRGNGYEGADITEHIHHFLNVPLVINKKERYIIDGEAIIYDTDFSIINKDKQFKNNRNTASGALALLDMDTVTSRRLSFIAWDVIKGGISDKEFHYNMEEAEDLGFTITPMFAIDCTKVEEDEINEINQSLLEIAELKGIPCDGVVWRINSIPAGDKRGRTEHHFLNAIAWKPKDEDYETKLLKIELSIGRTGVITPIAVFEPIDIDGSTVERASLHNISILEETLGQYPELYQKIWVAKANQIIPQITRAEKNNDPHDHCIFFKDNVFCPVCGERLLSSISASGVESLVCPNDKCDGKIINKIEHYCGKKGLDIKGISKATIGKLIDWGWINGLADIFRLDEHKTEWISKAGFGEASVGKILSAIASSRSSTPLESFISAIGIPLVGRAISKEIVKYYKTWEDFRAAVGGDWTRFDGFGEEINQMINTFDYTEADQIAEMINFKEVADQAPSADNKIFGQTFVITGRLNSYNRNALKEKIESMGGKVTGSVSGKTNYLVNNDLNSTSTKNLKAKELGIPIISEAELEQFF